MSGKFSAAVMFCSLVAISLAANRADESVVIPVKSDRGPASVAVAKKEEMLLASMKTQSSLKHTEKLRGPLNVQLEIMGAPPEKVGDIFILRGTVSSPKPLQGADYTWSIPDGVELVRGVASGHLDYVSSDQPAAIELTLKKVGMSNAQVHLMAVVSSGAAHFGDSAQFNTNVDSKATAAVRKQIKVLH